MLKRAALFVAIALACGAWHPGSGTDPNVVYVLSLPGNNPTVQSHINHGSFWDAPSQSLGNSMFWRTWIRNTPTGGGTGYVVADGFGGAHALLWNGYGAGNILTTPGGTISYSSDDTVPDGQWFENAIGIANDVAGNPGIITWMNGIATSFTSLGANTRVTCPGASGCGTLYVGGSSHSQWNGQIAMLQGFDQRNPIGAVTNFAPERTYSQNNAAGATPQPDFFADYTVPARVINDLSWGYASGVAPTITNRVKHPGHVFNLDSTTSCTSGLACENEPLYPLPTWVASNGGPWTTTAPPTPPGGRSLTPPVTPVGAKIFDSFSRQDQNYAFSNAPTLGSTEAGSLGPLAWQYGVAMASTGAPSSFPQQWGIFNGNAVVLTSVPVVAWVNNNSADMTASVDNRIGSSGSGVTEVAFRVQDGANWWVCGIEASGAVAGGLTLYLGRFVAGVYTLASSTAATVTRAQHTVTAITSGTSITCQVDNGATWILTTTSSILQSATGAGLAQNYNAAINEGLARWDNFTVK